MNTRQIPTYDRIAIEERARRLRAEATAAGARAFATWVRRQVARIHVRLSGHRDSQAV